MKTLKYKSFLITLCMLGGISVNAAAETGNGAENGAYLGGGIGYGRINGEDYTNTNGDLSKSRVSWKALVGTKVNSILSVEGQYIDFGAANRSSDRIQATGWTAGVVLELPLETSITPYGKIGALFWETDSSFNNISRNEDGTDLTVGLGLRFMLSPHLALRTEYERFEMDNTDIDNLSLNVQFNF